MDSYAIYRARRDLTPRERDGAESLLAALFLDYVIRHDPLLSLGQELGAVITRVEQPRPYVPTPLPPLPEESAPPEATSSPNTPVEAHSEREILADIQLVRLAVAQRELAVMRLWLYAHRFGDGSGRIAKEVLLGRLKQVGVLTSPRTFNDLLKRGQWRYWTIGQGRSAEGREAAYIYLTGWEHLARRLTARAMREHPEQVQDDPPGAPRVWLDLSGDLQEAQAAVYAAWIAQKAEKQGFVRISRARLRQLWNRSTKTLLLWEKQAHIRVEACYAEHHDPHAALIPGHAYLCLDSQGKEFVSWRTPNRYTPAQETDEQPGKGQRRKVRTAARAVIEQKQELSQPVEKNADGLQNKTGKLYFTDRKTRRSTVLAAKSLRRHLRQHQDVWERRHYTLLGKRQNVYIEEYSTGDSYRDLEAQRNYKGEQAPRFRRRAAFYQMGWKERDA